MDAGEELVDGFGGGAGAEGGGVLRGARSERDDVSLECS